MVRYTPWSHSLLCYDYCVLSHLTHFPVDSVWIMVITCTFVILFRIVHSFRYAVIKSILPMNCFRATLFYLLIIVLLNMATTSHNA